MICSVRQAPVDLAIEVSVYSPRLYPRGLCYSHGGRRSNRSSEARGTRAVVTKLDNYFVMGHGAKNGMGVF